MCMRPDSTDVPTIYYWRVNSSSLDGALLLDFIKDHRTSRLLL